MVAKVEDQKKLHQLSENYSIGTTFVTKQQGEYVLKLRKTSAILVKFKQSVYNVSSENVNGVIEEVSKMFNVKLSGPMPTRQQHTNFVLEQNGVLLYYLVNNLYDQQLYSYICDITTKKGNNFHINLLQCPDGKIFNIGNFLIHDKSVESQVNSLKECELDFKRIIQLVNNNPNPATGKQFPIISVTLITRY